MAEDVQDLLRQRRYDEALERLLDGYEQKVFRMAVAMLRDRGRAQDVTQDIFLKLWRALPSYDGRAALSTWLYTIARNTCLTAVRAESYRRPAGDVSDARAACRVHPPGAHRPAECDRADCRRFNERSSRCSTSKIGTSPRSRRCSTCRKARSKATCTAPGARWATSWSERWSVTRFRNRSSTRSTVDPRLERAARD